MEITKRPIRQIGSDIKESAWGAVIESLVLMTLGMLFIILQDTMVHILAYIVVVFFIVKGGFQIINYYIEKGQSDFLSNNLLSGVVSILIGTATLVIGDDIARVFRVIIGIIICESLVRITQIPHLTVIKNTESIKGITLYG